MVKLLSISSLVVLMTGAVQRDVVLTGTAKDCLGRQYFQIRGVTVAAFDPAKNRNMVDLITLMDTATFVDADLAAMSKLEARYEQLVDMATRGTALARATSDAAGTFHLTFAPTDSVLVFGYAETEDTPAYYSYRMVGGRVNSSFYLDMSGGECHYPTTP